jgi:dihydropteroate synthase
MNHLRFGSRPVATDRALVMAIVNRTKDSFYDKGATFAEQAALDRVARAVDEGADLVDIGGVKAGAHGEVVDVTAEISRVVPFVEKVRALHPNVVISVDTWRHEVAELVCQAGADLINDTWAGADPDLVGVAGAHRVGIVCSHTGGLTPRSDPFRVNYADVVADVIAETVKSAQTAVEFGVPAESILIDPTHDFGKNTWHGLEILRRTSELVDTGWPVLMALSNKDFVGETLGVEVTERLHGTLAATAVAAMAGAKVFRAHNVAETRQVLDMVASIQGTRPPTKVLRALA